MKYNSTLWHRQRFTLTWYQKYFRLLALYKQKSLRKYDKKGEWHGANLEYHHVKPVSIYGTDNNLIIVVPVKAHTRLHYLLWKHYEEKGMEAEAGKMKYAYETLNDKYGMMLIDEAYGINYSRIKDEYKYLIKHYGV